MHMPEYKTTKNKLCPSNRLRALECSLKKIEAYAGLEENKHLILLYDKQCKANGNKVSTRLSFLMVLHHLQKFANEKHFKDLTRDDIIEFLEFEKIGKFEDTTYKRKHGRPTRGINADSTMNLRRHLVRKFFAFIHGYKKGYPPVVDWMKVARISRDKNHRINSSDLLVPEEIYTIISHAESPRDKALLSFLAESGCRVGEASILKVKNVVFTQKGIEVRVNGKTGLRIIPLVVSKPDLENWLNNFHLFASEPEAPLFPRFNKKQLRSNLQTSGIWNVVKKTVSRASLVTKSLQKKNISPHSFRHARATELARLGWTEAMLRVYFGRTDDSTMPSVYIHLSQSDVARRYYLMYGKEDTGETAAPRQEENKPCPHCFVRNPTGYITCFSCHMPLDKANVELKQGKQYTVNMLNFIAQDSKLSKKLLLLIQEASRKQDDIHQKDETHPMIHAK